jgi:hypothetical protein
MVATKAAFASGRCFINTRSCCRRQVRRCRVVQPVSPPTARSARSLRRPGAGQRNQLGLLFTVKNRRWRRLLAAQNRLKSLFHQLRARWADWREAGIQRNDLAVASPLPSSQTSALSRIARFHQPLRRAFPLPDQGARLLSSALKRTTCFFTGTSLAESLPPYGGGGSESFCPVKFVDGGH